MNVTDEGQDEPVEYLMAGPVPPPENEYECDFDFPEFGAPIEVQPANSLSDFCSFPDGSVYQRYLTGAEIALAAVCSVSAFRRWEPDDRPTEPESHAVHSSTRVLPSLELIDCSADQPFDQSIQHIREEAALGKKSGSVSKSLARPTVAVGLHDSLVSIAETILGDRGLCWLILDLNAARLRVSTLENKRIAEVREGELLDLPFSSEIGEFQAKHAIGRDPGSLITVVLSRSSNCNHLDKRIKSADLEYSDLGSLISLLQI